MDIPRNIPLYLVLMKLNYYKCRMDIPQVRQHLNTSMIFLPQKKEKNSKGSRGNCASDRVIRRFRLNRMAFENLEDWQEL